MDEAAPEEQQSDVADDDDEDAADAERATIRNQVQNRLLGGELQYTRKEIAELIGVQPYRIARLWVAFGFAADPNPDAKMFTEGDLLALRLFTTLVDRDLLATELELTVARSLGQSFARLAEWQASVAYERVREEVLKHHSNDTGEDQRAFTERIAGTVFDELLPGFDFVQSYLWRRHLAANVVRAGDQAERKLAIGFADMVGYTRLARNLDDRELDQLLEAFESTATTVITQAGGWVVKTLGDEVMFAAGSPQSAGRIALELHDFVPQPDEVPALRVGVAYGRALTRFGDLFGPTVNIASRLTTSARPGTVLVDEAMAAEIVEDNEMQIKSLRALQVRGYRKLPAFALQWRPKKAR